MEKDMLIAKGYVEKSEDKEGLLDVSVASSNVADRDGEIINQDGWDLKNFKKNPQLLWAHNVREVRPPIGKVTRIWFDGEGKSKVMKFKAMFDMADQFAADIYRKIKEGFLNAFSVGFMPLEKDGNTYTKTELLEISVVPVPANPSALVEIRSKGIEPMEWKDFTHKEAVEEIHVDPIIDEPVVKELNTDELKALMKEVMRESVIQKNKKDIEDVRDALRIVAQAVNVALKKIKEKGGE
jgi:HK97 family phage prohead protease